jgi:hypothetical protein
MSDIQSLIQKLQNSNPNKRYDACEELRVMVLRQPLPQKAIDALNIAANDPDPDVADAAQRALALHSTQQTSELAAAPDSTATSGFRGAAVLAAGFALFLILDFVFLEVNYVLVNTLCPITFGLFFTMIAAFVSRKTSIILLVFVIATAIGFILFGASFYQ